MARILCIDYGLKRSGIAATDPLKIAAFPVDTVDTDKLWDYILQYLSREEVEELVLGDARHHDGSDSIVTHELRAFAQKLAKLKPDLPIILTDESYSSAEAKEVILRSGVKKKKRRDKALVDRIAAVIILQRYLGHT